MTRKTNLDKVPGWFVSDFLDDVKSELNDIEDRDVRAERHAEYCDEAAERWSEIPADERKRLIEEMAHGVVLMNAKLKEYEAYDKEVTRQLALIEPALRAHLKAQDILFDERRHSFSNWDDIADADGMIRLFMDDKDGQTVIVRIPSPF